MKNAALRLGFALTLILVGHSDARPAMSADTISGVWSTTESVPLGPYVIEIKTKGSAVTGQVRQTEGPQQGPADIYQGKVEGTTISFNVNSPDGHRVVSFTGVIKGKEITFSRGVRVLEGGVPGANGLFGANGPSTFVVRRSGPS